MIKFEGKEYPSVIVNLPFGERKVSNIQLNESMMNFDGSYVSNEARLIDEEIFYFVEESALGLQETKLVELILSEI